MCQNGSAHLVTDATAYDHGAAAGAEAPRRSAAGALVMAALAPAAVVALAHPLAAVVAVAVLAAVVRWDLRAGDYGGGRAPGPPAVTPG